MARVPPLVEYEAAVVGDALVPQDRRQEEHAEEGAQGADQHRELEPDDHEGRDRHDRLAAHEQRPVAVTSRSAWRSRRRAGEAADEREEADRADRVAAALPRARGWGASSRP